MDIWIISFLVIMKKKSAMNIVVPADIYVLIFLVSIWEWNSAESEDN